MIILVAHTYGPVASNVKGDKHWAHKKCSVNSAELNVA